MVLRPHPAAPHGTSLATQESYRHSPPDCRRTSTRPCSGSRTHASATTTLTQPQTDRPTPVYLFTVQSSCAVPHPRYRLLVCPLSHHRPAFLVLLVHPHPQPAHLLRPALQLARSRHSLELSRAHPPAIREREREIYQSPACIHKAARQSVGSYRAPANTRSSDSAALAASSAVSR